MLEDIWEGLSKPKNAFPAPGSARYMIVLMGWQNIGLLGMLSSPRIWLSYIRLLSLRSLFGLSAGSERMTVRGEDPRLTFAHKWLIQV